MKVIRVDPVRKFAAEVFDTFGVDLVMSILGVVFVWT